MALTCQRELKVPICGMAEAQTVAVVWISALPSFIHLPQALFDVMREKLAHNGKGRLMLDTGGAIGSWSRR